jgi:putative membrane protein
MKDFTRINKVFTGALLISLLFMQSCGGTLSYQQAVTKNRKNIEELKRLDDAMFLVEAKSYSLLESKLYELAKEKGYSAAVVELSREFSEKRRNMERELNKVARKEKVSVPVGMKGEHQRIYDRVASTARSDFDPYFLQTLRRITEESEAMYSNHASAGSDAEIRAFAAKRVGIFRNNQDDISRVDNELLQTHR